MKLLSQWGKAVAIEILWVIIWAWHKTLRVRIHGDEIFANPGYDKDTHYQPVAGSTGNVIAHWHENLVLFTFGFFDRKPPFMTLASRHRDATWGVKLIAKLGYSTFRGSSTRGGGRALIELKEKVQSGINISLAIDGPTGPRYKAKPGALRIARDCEADLIPMRAFASSYFCLGTWDKLRVPYPFATVDIVYASKFAWKHIEKSSSETKEDLAALAKRINAIELPRKNKQA
jgi:lysophospholipid acyltransferase (LPLAT)-like uncharacterized protein